MGKKSKNNFIKKTKKNIISASKYNNYPLIKDYIKSSDTSNILKNLSMKEYKCSICNPPKEYKNSSSYNKHLRIKNSEKLEFSHCHKKYTKNG